MDRRLARVLTEHAAGLNLTAEEIHAVKRYQSDEVVHTYRNSGFKGHELINAHLRDQDIPGATQPLKRTVARWVNDLQGAIWRSRVPIAVTAWRGMSRGTTVEWLAAKLDDPAAGGPVILDGLSSTSLDRDRAERFATEPLRVMLELHIPAGTPALWVSALGDGRFRAQRELLLDHESHVWVKPIPAQTDDVVTVVGEVLS